MLNSCDKEVKITRDFIIIIIHILIIPAVLVEL